MTVCVGSISENAFPATTSLSWCSTPERACTPLCLSPLSSGPPTCREVSHTVIFMVCVFLYVVLLSSLFVSFCRWRGQSCSDLDGLCISVCQAVLFTVCVFLHGERSVTQWSLPFVSLCMSCSDLHHLCLSACGEVSHTVIFMFCVYLLLSSPFVSFCMQRGQLHSDLYGLCLSACHHSHAVIFIICVFLHVERSVKQWSSWFVYFCMSCSYLCCLCLSACREVSHTVIFSDCIFLHVMHWSSLFVYFCMQRGQSHMDLHCLCRFSCREVSHTMIFTICVFMHAERSVMLSSSVSCDLQVFRLWQRSTSSRHYYGMFSPCVKIVSCDLQVFRLWQGSTSSRHYYGMFSPCVKSMSCDLQVFRLWQGSTSSRQYHYGMCTLRWGSRSAVRPTSTSKNWERSDIIIGPNYSSGKPQNVCWYDWVG